MELVYEVV